VRLLKMVRLLWTKDIFRKNINLTLTLDKLTYLGLVTGVSVFFFFFFLAEAGTEASSSAMVIVLSAITLSSLKKWSTFYDIRNCFFFN